MNPLRMLRAHLGNQRGYTLIEMVSVLGIVGVLSGLIIANTAVGNKRQQLRDAVAGYVTAAKQAESLAASNQLVTEGTTTVTSPRFAYGVCITTSQVAGTTCTVPTGTQPADTYRLYARRTADRNYQSAPDLPDIISSHTLPKDVYFNQSLLTAQWIDYLPPTPSLQARGLSPAGELIIQLDHRPPGQTTPSYTRTIGIRPKAGAVYVK